MGWYTEACRALADWLGVRAHIVAFSPPRECSPLLYDILHDGLGTAHFIISGECSGTGKDRKLLQYIDQMAAAVLEACEKGFVAHNAFVVMSFGDTAKYAPGSFFDVNAIVLMLRHNQLRPLILTGTASNLLRGTSANPYRGENPYQTMTLNLNNTVVYSYAPPSPQDKDPVAYYKKVIKRLPQVIFAPEFFNETIAETNLRLGNNRFLSNTPATTGSKPLIFSKENKSSNGILSLDSLAFLFLFFSAYRLAHKAYAANCNKNKNKPRAP